MEISEIENLVGKIETAKAEKAKAEGAMEQIQSKWKDEFGCSSIDEVNSKIDELGKKSEELKEKRDKYIQEIEEVMEKE